MGNLVSRRKHRQEWTPANENENEKRKSNSSLINGNRKESVEATYTTKIASNDLLSSSNGEAKKTVLPKADSSPKVTPEETSKTPECEPSKKPQEDATSESVVTSSSSQQVPVSSSIAQMDESTVNTQVEQPPRTESNVAASVQEVKTDLPEQQTAQTQEPLSNEPSKDSGSDANTEQKVDQQPLVESAPAPILAESEIKSEEKVEEKPIENKSESEIKPQVENEEPKNIQQDAGPKSQTESTVSDVNPPKNESEVVASPETKEEVKSESVPSVSVDVTSDSSNSDAINSTAERILEEVTAEGIKKAAESIQSVGSQDVTQSDVNTDANVAPAEPAVQVPAVSEATPVVSEVQAQSEKNVSESIQPEENVESKALPEQVPSSQSEIANPDLSSQETTAIEPTKTEAVPEQNEPAKSDESKSLDAKPADSDTKENVTGAATSEQTSTPTSDTPAESTDTVGEDDKSKQSTLDNLNNNSDANVAPVETVVPTE